MKIAAVAAIIPLLTVLFLNRVEVSTPLELSDDETFSYTMPWTYSSLDEAVWLAVDDLANIRKYIDEDVSRYVVVIPARGALEERVVLAIDKVDFDELTAGSVTADEFIRNSVSFQ
jgi:hypothetical protein